MARLSALLLVALLLPLPARATLVVMVPSRDGLVVAADSRMSFLGSECDGAFKIVELARPARTVVMVTGDSIFLKPPAAGETDVCHYVESAPRMLDVAAIVRHYLDRNPAGPARFSLEDLGAVCVRAVDRFRLSNPAVFQAFAGKDLFSVIVASYDPASRVATLRNFVVRVDRGTQRIEAARFDRIAVTPKDRRGVWIYGETAYVEKNVYAGFGRQYLSANTLNFILGNKPVGETPLSRAVAAAVNVIQATSRATEKVPAPSGIGGPIRAVLLGSKPRPEPLAWAAQ
jgi:hypothetical protein